MTLKWNKKYGYIEKEDVLTRNKFHVLNKDDDNIVPLREDPTSNIAQKVENKVN